MTVIESRVNRSSAEFAANAEVNRGLATQLRELAATVAAGGSAAARAQHEGARRQPPDRERQVVDRHAGTLGGAGSRREGDGDALGLRETLDEVGHLPVLVVEDTKVGKLAGEAVTGQRVAAVCQDGRVEGYGDQLCRPGRDRPPVAEAFERHLRARGNRERRRGSLGGDR